MDWNAMRADVVFVHLWLHPVPVFAHPCLSAINIFAVEKAAMVITAQTMIHRDYRACMIDTVFIHSTYELK